MDFRAPSHRFALLLASAVLALAGSGCSNESKPVVTTKLPISKPAEDVTPRVDDANSTDTTFQKVVESEATEIQVEEKLAKFGEYLERYVRGLSPDVPGFIDAEFEGSGVQRENLKPRFVGDRIKIGRWQADKRVPKLKGPDAFKDLVANIASVWMKSEGYSIDFKIYQSTETDSVLVRLVVETFGRIEETKGLQATSLWETIWNKGSNGQLSLAAIKVLGREELSIESEGGQLLQDCTRSVFANCDAWDSQLKYGLDQWSRQIPGLNVLGHEGLAIGDINDDGLDDLYVCHGHGLANLLLLQNPDGTVRNVAAEGGVDLLDETRSALIVDLDNDGDRDLALATDESVVLFSNRGNEKFQLERKLAIGYDGSCLSAADFDLDGDLDLLLCKFRNVRDVQDFIQVPENFVDSQSGGRNVLLRNDEGWNFVDATAECGLTENNFAHSRSAKWVDFDLDGDQDLFVANEWSSPRLYRNQNGWFSDVTTSSEVYLPSQTRSVSVGDFNRDGKPDLFLANEASSRRYRVLKGKANAEAIDAESAKALLAQSHVWFSTRKSASDGENELAGIFTGYPLPAPVFTTESSFGSAVADLNNDGLEDILVANGYLSRTSSDDLQSFWASCLAEDAGEVDQLKSKAMKVADMIRSGFSISGNQRNRCYLNMGAIGFANFSACSGVDLLNDARAIATTDWDSDGDTDIIMTSRTGPRIRVLINQLKSSNRWLSLKLAGTRCNRDAIGTRVEVWLSGLPVPIMRWVNAESGFLSQSSKTLQVGLGKEATIQKVRVVWPGGKSQTFEGLEANRAYELTEGVPEAAERSTRRFELKVAQEQLAGNVGEPKTERSIFYPASVFPRINIEDQSGIRYQLKSSPDQGLLAVFHNGDQSSKAVLGDLAANAAELAGAELGCAAAFIDSTGNVSLGEGLKRAQSSADSVEWPWPSGLVGEADVAKLRLACGEWFSHQHLPKMPFAVLLDRTGAVKSFYPSTKIGTSEVLKDKPLVDRGYALDWLELTSRKGRWINGGRTAQMTRFKDQLLAIGDKGEAMYINKLIAPGTAFRLAMHGVELSSRNQLEQAGVFFNRAIAIHPGCVAAHVNKGKLYRLMAAKLGKSDPIRDELLGKAAASFIRGLDVDPSSEEAVIGFADANVDQMRLNPAIAKLTEFLELFPESARVHAILGRLFFSKKKYVKAAKHLTYAFDAHPTLPYVSGDLGFLYLASGEVSRAKKFLRLANRLQPGDRNILRYLAEAEFATGNHESAVRLLKRYLDGSPKHLRSNSLLAWLLATSPYERFRDAKQGIELMTPMVDVYGDKSAFAKEILAACHAENGEFKTAIEIQQSAMDMVTRKSTTDKYSRSQEDAMRERLKLYKSGLPYRSENLARMPLKQIGKGLGSQ